MPAKFSAFENLNDKEKKIFIENTKVQYEIVKENNYIIVKKN